MAIVVIRGERVNPLCVNPHSDMLNHLTLKALNYFCVKHGSQRVFRIQVIINVLVSSFRFI